MTKTLIFVYGTLKRGYGLNRFMVDNNARLVEEDATLNRQLCLIGVGIPFLLKPRKGDRTYMPKGEVYEVPNRALDRLDQIESAYDRTKCKTLSGLDVEFYLGRGERDGYYGRMSRNAGPEVAIDEAAGTMTWNRPDRSNNW